MTSFCHSIKRCELRILDFFHFFSSCCFWDGVFFRSSFHPTCFTLRLWFFFTAVCVADSQEVKEDHCLGQMNLCGLLQVLLILQWNYSEKNVPLSQNWTSQKTSVWSDENRYELPRRFFENIHLFPSSLLLVTRPCCHDTQSPREHLRLNWRAALIVNKNGWWNIHMSQVENTDSSRVFQLLLILFISTTEKTSRFYLIISAAAAGWQISNWEYFSNLSNT